MIVELDNPEFQKQQIEALQKELARYKEIFEQFQQRYDTVKALETKVIDPIFEQPIKQ